MDFEEALNEEQYAAATAPDGPALVVAAAGSGKTRTLTYRLAWLARERGIPPHRVLLLTFTNKAAREMLSRAGDLLEMRFDAAYSGTFHSFANRLLRAHAPKVGFANDYTILDADDAKRLMRSCIGELGVERKHFPKPEVLLSLLGVVQGRMGDVEAAVAERFEHAEADPERVLEACRLYAERKRAQSAMDFDDLLLHALELLGDAPRIRDVYREEFRYVLVDEYQDVNAVQAELVRLLVGPNANLMVVGDDFQSIYSWRGADFRNFLEFEKNWPGARVYKLQINYRSRPEILDVANAVIAGNPKQFRKELRAVRPSASRPRLAKMRDGSAQARYVISRVRALCREGVSPSGICVLYRSHFHAMELQMELAREQMPYVVTSGVRFFEQAHIKDVCCTLRILANPSDEMAFCRLVEMLPRVGAKGSRKIFGQKMQGRADLSREDTHERLLAALPAAARPDWEKLRPLFLAYREEGLENDPGEIIHRFNKVFYGEYLNEVFDNAKFRREDVDGLIDFSGKFENVAAFLSEIALLSNLDAGSGSAPDAAETEALRLSTIHQAKGLEWEAVFVLFLNEEMFPSRKAVEESGDDEERRLFYVAVTRAKDELFLCVPLVRRQRDGGMIFLEPSRFVEEIPEGLLVEESIGY